MWITKIKKDKVRQVENEEQGKRERIEGHIQERRKIMLKRELKQGKM